MSALDAALRKALAPVYPALERIQLADYKVRILDGSDGTERDHARADRQPQRRRTVEHRRRARQHHRGSLARARRLRSSTGCWSGRVAPSASTLERSKPRRKPLEAMNEATIVLLAGRRHRPRGRAPTRAACSKRSARASATTFAFEEQLIGGIAIDETGDPLPDATLAACKAADAVLLGAVGGPKWDDPNAKVRPEQGLLALRTGLGALRQPAPGQALPGARRRARRSSPSASRASTCCSCAS